MEPSDNPKPDIPARSDAPEQTKEGEGEKEKEKKPSIEIQVVNQDGTAIVFKMSETTSFQKMFNAYYKKHNIQSTAVRFMYEGQRLDHRNTPKEVGMETGDMIDAMLQQTGGNEPNFWF